MWDGVPWSQPFGVRGWTSCPSPWAHTTQNWHVCSTQPSSHQKSSRQHEHSSAYWACCISSLNKSLLNPVDTILYCLKRIVVSFGKMSRSSAYSPWHHSTVVQGPPGAKCFPGPSWQQRPKQHRVSTISWFSSWNLEMLALLISSKNMQPWQSEYPFVLLPLIETIVRTTWSRLTAQKIEETIKIIL